MSRKYDVFISYRRDGGDDCAIWLKTRLERDGFHPYLDVEAYSPTNYREKISQTLHEVDSVIIILTNHCLDRCFEERDAVHDEIAESIALNKNIVSILKRGFTFPDKLPDDINCLRDINALPLENYYREAFYADLLRALRCHAGPAAEPPAEKSRHRVQLQRVEGAYCGFLSGHVSEDLRLIGLLHPQTGALDIRQIGTDKLICRLAPRKHPFSEYQLVFDSGMHYLYLLRGKNALIFDILHNRYTTSREIALPFAAKRTYDNGFIGDGDALILIDYNQERPYTAVHLSPGGEAHAISLKQYPAGQAIASVPLAGKRALIMTQPNGCVYALHMNGKKLLQYSAAVTVEGCLQSGKRFGDRFSPENLYWCQSSSNGVTNYTDFYRTEDGERLHRVFHGQCTPAFTPDQTAVWYDPQSLRLMEADIANGLDRTLLEEKDFSQLDAFCRLCPVTAVYLHSRDAFVFLSVRPEAECTFRLVMTDRSGRVLARSEDMPFPEQVQYFRLQENGTQLLLSVHCGEPNAGRTHLYIASVQTD